MKKILILFFIILYPLEVFSDEPGIISLMYHRVGEGKYPSTNVSTEMFNEHLQIIESNRLKFIEPEQFKNQILDGTIPLTKLGNPTAVKKLEKYSGTGARAGEMFTEILKGAPAPVRAAIRYNDLLRLWQLDRKYNLITMADKVKWIYLKSF